MSDYCNGCGQPGLRGVTHACIKINGFPFIANPNPSTPTQTGWSCPSCGNGNAPWLPYCHFCDAAARRALLASQEVPVASSTAPEAQPKNG